MSRTLMLSSQTVQDYAQLGAVVLRGVLNAEELQTLEQGIEHNLSNLSPWLKWPVVQTIQADSLKTFVLGNPMRLTKKFCAIQPCRTSLPS